MTLPIPGQAVIFKDQPRARSAPTDTGTAFFVAEADSGPLAPRLCTSLADVASRYGTDTSYSYLYNAAEGFFRGGGARLWVSRAASSTAVTASKDLLNDSAAATLQVQAAGPGESGNSLQVRVQTNAEDSTIPVGQFTIAVLLSGTVIDSTPPMADKASALVYAAANWKYAVLVDQAGTGNPVALAATSLTGGLANRGAIADGDFQSALDRLTADYGPGQVAQPGMTTSTKALMTLAHAKARNRHGLLDAPDSGTIATVTAAARAADAGGDDRGRFGSMYWPWLVVPVPGSAYATKTIPPSGVVAGLAARSDARSGNANLPIAGYQRGVCDWAIATSQPTNALSAADRQALQDNGVNPFLFGYGDPGPVQFGNRTLRLESADPLWLQASGSRCMMQIAALSDEILRRHVHDQIDGRKTVQSAVDQEHRTMLDRLYRLGALYGDTPGDAYALDAISASVNPDAQLQVGKLTVALQVATSPGADRIELEVTRVAIGGVI